MEIVIVVGSAVFGLAVLVSLMRAIDKTQQSAAETARNTALIAKRLEEVIQLVKGNAEDD